MAGLYTGCMTNVLLSPLFRPITALVCALFAVLLPVAATAQPLSVGVSPMAVRAGIAFADMQLVAQGYRPGTEVLARFGPFNVTSATTVEMSGVIGTDTPLQFARMHAAFPDLQRLVMIECPGSEDDDANLRLARMVRSAGLSTYVPANGSVRSGAVELFLAGITRAADPRAEFAVHSWRDEYGHEGYGAAASDPVHREYLSYYRDMGMSDTKAHRFYAMTNSVPYESALYLKPRDLAAYGVFNANTADR